MSTIVANNNGVVLAANGQRLYGMDAELHLKREAQRDPEFELQVAKWIEKALGESLVDVNDLYVSLRSGVALCGLINKIVPGTIKKYTKTNLLPLMEMDNIQLYLKACWNIGIPSGDFFIVSDLYHKKSMPQVIQNIVSLSRVASSLGYAGEPLVAGNTGKDRVKNWEPVAAGGALKRVEDLEAGTPAERITQLSIALGEARHALDVSKSDNFNLQATMKELKGQHASDRERWDAEKAQLENRLKKFAPIDDGGEGAPGSMAVKALELHYQHELQASKAETEAERKRYAALEAKFEELKSKQSQTALELSRLKQDDKKKLGGSAVQPQQPEKPSWMSKVAAKKPNVRAPSIRMPTMTAESAAPVGSLGRSRTQSVALGEGESEGANYRLSTMLQLKSSDGSNADNRKTGFFFSADDLGAEGVEYMSEQLDTLFANQPIDQDASNIVNEMLLADSGRRTFTFALKEKLRALNFQKIQLDAGPFLTLLSLVNSALTGMQLEKQIDYIAMTFLLGASRAVFTTSSKSKMEDFLADHLRDHSIWADVRFWEQHFWDVVGKSFKKKFARLSIGKAQQAGWQEDQARFLSQFVASFAHEMGRWSLPEAAVKEFFDLVFERLVLGAKFQTACKGYYDKLVSRQVAQQQQDSTRMKHISMVMTSSQAARLAGTSVTSKEDANILQGWLRRKVHIMWINEWVSQSGTSLSFREHKQSSAKRLVVQMDKLVKVEVRNDSSLPNCRCIYIEAADVKVVVAPVKDTDDEINYWLNGLKKMQARFTNVSSKPTPTIPKKALPSTPSDDETSAASSPSKFTRVAPSAQAQQRASSLAELPTVSSTATTAVSSSSPLSESAVSIGRLRVKTMTSTSRSSSDLDVSNGAAASPAAGSAAGGAGAPLASPAASPKVSRLDSDRKVEGWLQVYGISGKNTSSKSLFGTLKKMTGSKWAPYWGSVSGSTIHLLKSQEDATLLGDLELDQVSLVEETSDKEMVGRVLRLSMLSGDTNLICPKESEFAMWNERIAAVVAAARAKNPAVTAAAASLSASSPSISRNSLFKARSSTVNKIVVERAAPLPGEALSGWVFVEEGDKWSRQWLAQKGTILTVLASEHEGAATRGGYDLLILAKVEQSAAPEAYGPAVTCWFGEFNTFVFSPERGQHAYWMTGLGNVLEKYKPKIVEPRRSAAPPSVVVAPAAAAPCMFSVGQQVWAQFSQDSLWYRAVVDAAREGDIYDVTFSEYRNQQRDCPLNTLRPINDPAMLALLNTTLEQVTSASSVDRNRPMSVQIPASIAQALRKGTFVTIDPAAAVREQQLAAPVEEEPADGNEEEMTQQEIPEEATIASSPVSQTSIMTRKTVDAMYVKVLEDDDEDEDLGEEVVDETKREAEEMQRRRNEEEEAMRKEKEKEEEQKKMMIRAQEEEAKRREEDRLRVEEERAKLAKEKLLLEQKLEEERARVAKERELMEAERARLAKEKELLEAQRRAREEQEAKRKEEEREAKRKEEEEEGKRKEEAARARDLEEQRLKEEEERLLVAEIEAQKRALEEATKLRQAEERKEKLRLAKLAKEEERKSRAAAEEQKETEPVEVKSSPAPAAEGRSAAVQAALARAKALTASVKTDGAAANAPTKPLPDPFG